MIINKTLKKVACPPSLSPLQAPISNYPGNPNLKVSPKIRKPIILLLREIYIYEESAVLRMIWGEDRDRIKKNEDRP